MLTGGEAVVHMLGLQGARFAFGMGGFQTLPYYDALARQDLITHVLIRDEKHGAFAADGYARLANRPAIADATLGPGATNLVSGAAESFGASVPLILLTGEVNSGIAGRAATQECDQVAVLQPVTKATVEIRLAERIPELIRRAYTLATSGRPGPVHINVPEEVMHGRYDYPENDLFASVSAREVGGNRARPNAGAVEEAARLLASAHSPVVIAGGGLHLSAAYDQLASLVERLQLPTATTISGKGAISELHPLSLGICGRFSSIANDLIKQADVILLVGCKTGEIATNRWSLFPAGAQILQIDVDPAELDKVYPVTVGMIGDAKLALADLDDAVRQTGKSHSSSNGDTVARLARLRSAWREQVAVHSNSTESPINMARVIRDLEIALPEDAVVVADGGFAAHWSALYYRVPKAGRCYVANRGSAAIGYALPGSIGVQLAVPHRPVVALCGDNGFAMAVAELETARRAGLRQVLLVLNNGTLGYVKALQHDLYHDRFISVDFLEVDYAQVAKGFGCYGVRIDEPQSLLPALQDALVADRPTVLDVRITTDPAQMLPGIDSRTTRPAQAAGTAERSKQ
jgi:acetolactate synthase I/II/III large subunit